MIQMSPPMSVKNVHRTWAVCPSPLVAMAHCRGNLQGVPPWSMVLMAVQVCCGCYDRDIVIYICLIMSYIIIFTNKDGMWPPKRE